MTAHYNFYETLDLDRQKSSAELIEAIDARLTQLHEQNVPQTDERVQELFAARAVLGIENNREQYDSVLNSSDAPTLTIPDLQVLAQTGLLPAHFNPMQQPMAGQGPMLQQDPTSLEGQNPFPGSTPSQEAPAAAQNPFTPQQPNQDGGAKPSRGQSAASSFFASIPTTIQAVVILVGSVAALEFMRGTIHALRYLIADSEYGEKYPVMVTGDYTVLMPLTILMPVIVAIVIALTLGKNRAFGSLVNVGFGAYLLIFSLSSMIIYREGIAEVLLGMLELMIAIGIIVCAVLPDSRKYFSEQDVPAKQPE